VIPWLQELSGQARMVQRNAEYIRANSGKARVYLCDITHERLLALIRIAEAAQEDIQLNSDDEFNRPSRTIKAVEAAGRVE
jgi:hypothetical protein